MPLSGTVRTYLRTPNRFEDTEPSRAVHSVKCVSEMLTGLRYHPRRSVQSQSTVPQRPFEPTPATSSHTVR
jgi:hypothetical protein